MKIITAEGPVFFSQLDEDSFFGWLKSITAVQSVTGSGRFLEVKFEEDRLSDQDLRELIAIFWRYKMNMGPLKNLENDFNSHWFRGDSRSYWHAAIWRSYSE